MKKRKKKATKAQKRSMAGIVNRSPTRIDPTRTSGLRRKFIAAIKKKFAKLKLKIADLLLKEDALGLIPQSHNPFDLHPSLKKMLGNTEGSKSGRVITYDQNLALNTRWKFSSDPSKVKAFKEWLKQQVKAEVTSQTEEQLWQAYVDEGYRKGAGRAFDDARKVERAAKGSAQEELDFYRGSREEFLRSSFANAVDTDRVRLLAGRSFDELDDISSTMSNRIVRHLTDGLVQGQSPRDIARTINDDIDVGQNRAIVIARTEIIRAHAEGQLTALDKLGVQEVGVMVEWSTAGDDRVCELCAPLEGTVLRIEEARGMLPRHPNCFADPETPIATKLGWFPLKSIRIGDWVLTHMNRYRRVTQVHRNQSDFGTILVCLATGNGSRSLEVTSSHPVFSRGKWVNADSIKKWDQLTLLHKSPIDRDNEKCHVWTEVIDVSSKRLDLGETLYNLSVEEDESFIVARSPTDDETDVLMYGSYIVHNCRCAWIPANIGEDDEDQNTTYREVTGSIEMSSELGNDDFGPNEDISRNRPQSVLD